MKKISIIILMAVITYACSKKTITTQAAPAAASTTTPAVDSVATMQAMGRIIFTNRCGRCHALKNPSNYTEQQWTNILKMMAPKARLTETETAQVHAFLLANAKKS
jgi:hypothetical protein